MLNIFATPTIMQNYVVDPIIFRFTRKLEISNPEFILYRGRRTLRIASDEKVVKILQDIINSYSGFRSYSEDNKMIWVHSMKPSRNYQGNLLLLILEDAGTHFEFYSEMRLGTRKKESYTFSIFGWLSILSISICLGFIGRYEVGDLSTAKFLVSSISSMASFVIFSYLECKVNPCMIDEDSK